MFSGFSFPFSDCHSLFGLFHRRDGELVSGMHCYALNLSEGKFLQGLIAVRKKAIAGSNAAHKSVRDGVIDFHAVK